ncbi:uncharacterized protein LOC105422855 [Pogonomyrmex barbatus]|uniref:Uncharacterized protein LOC105422855 n=1 Tax=Pogonomyrmex barbatus TaxID=144034 RepID=A0A6I9VSH2_9HYME|nr:uncharacterized protein LOC105422855 [Pogonomyrmex barbatus]
MWQAQRRITLRLARAYRTVSHAAATVLAGTPPLDLLALGHAEVYRHVRQVKEQGVVPTARIMEPLRLKVRQWVIESWKARLHEPTVAGARTVEAIRPCLEDWLGRAHGGLSFRLVQVLTGGCFGRYLHRIGRERTARCPHCAADEDSAQHTLEECDAWVVERGVLVPVLDGDFSLSTIVRRMVDSEEIWREVSSF